MATQTQPKPQTQLEQAFRDRMTNRQQRPDEPQWLMSLKQSAFSRFETLGFPTRRNEAWHYVDLSELQGMTFLPFEPGDQPEVSLEDVYSSFLKEAAHSRFVFVNGQFSEMLSDLSGLPVGVRVAPLSTALVEHEDILQQALTRHAGDVSDAFMALNSALFDDGLFVSVPDEMVLEKPIQVLFITHNNSEMPKTATPRSVVIAGKNAKVTVVTQYMSLGGGAYLNNTAVELVAEEGATIEYYHVQTESPQAYQIATTKAILGRESDVSVTSLSFGGKLARHNIDLTFAGDHGRCRLHGLSVLNGKTQVYDHLRVDHAQPGCVSEQLYKGILAGSSVSDFNGTIVIRRDGALSDATQLNRNLLLSDEAKVYTRPQLRIDNDDVKCSHGATVGQLNEEELFYLASRGISYETARGVLTLGFAGEIIDKVSVPSLRRYLVNQVQKRLGAKTGEVVSSSWSV